MPDSDAEACRRAERGFVRAAGGVVVRVEDGQATVAVVHRPRRRDWTFPKGKAEGEEDDATCALREVWEETGLRCAIKAELGTTEYLDGRNRPKVVRYYLMRVLAGTFQPSGEVDELRFIPVARLGDLLTYAADREFAASLRLGAATAP